MCSRVEFFFMYDLPHASQCDNLSTAVEAAVQQFQERLHEHESDERKNETKATEIVDTVLSALKERRFNKYWDIIPLVKQILLETKCSENKKCFIIQTTICKIAIHSYSNGAYTPVSGAFDAQTADKLGRVLANFTKRGPSFYSTLNSDLVKDIAFSCGQLVSCKIRLYEPVRFPRRAVLQDIRLLPLLLRYFGGSFMEGHIDNEYINEFSKEGFEESFLLLADYMKQHPEIRGLIVHTWYYDPKLRDISPRLAEKTDISHLTGARLFRANTTSANIEDALTKSKTRRDLYEKKLYTPQAYLLVWRAKDLLRWANAVKQNDKKTM